jgi:hypothetical protein
VSLPLFPSMREDEVRHVIRVVKGLCVRHMRESRVLVEA